MSHLPAQRYRRKITLSCADSPSRTEQAHKDDCEIHRIMEKYVKTGLVQHKKEYQGTYLDMTNAPDFADAQRQIAAGYSMFETVPARIRADFDNKPDLFIDFMQNADNRDKMTEYGLPTDHLPDVKTEPIPKVPPKTPPPVADPPKPPAGDPPKKD